jgi:conjugal transfer pilus assembly protein TraV
MLPMNTHLRTTLHLGIVLLTSAIALSGCAGRPKYQCPFTGGVKCLGAIDVYRASEEGTLNDPVEADQGNASARPITGSDEWAGETVVGDDGSLVIADSLSVAPAVVETNEDPLLSPARVLRVWVAPWEDASGALHLAGYVYSEISKRKWRVGNVAAPSRPTLRLLDAPTGAGSSPSSGEPSN